MNSSNEANLNLDINKLFLDYFDYPEKGDYNWKLVKEIKQDNQDDIEIALFLGENNEDKNITIYVKETKFSYKSNNNEIKRILKEVYFLVLLRGYDYFAKLDKIILNKSDSKNRLFLIFKENTLALSDIINISNKNENEKNKIIDNKDLIKYIIYQISSALYILHSNNIIHNNLKPNNIFINNKGRISIADFGSMSYKDEDSGLCTFFYSSPDFLNDIQKIRDEKSDMWALGVIILELFLNKIEYFRNKDLEIDYSVSMKLNILDQLKFTLSKFGVNNSSTLEKEKIKEIIYDKDEKYKFEFTEEEKAKINDENAMDLIKNLLVLNPQKRYSAEEVLQSPYLEDYIQDLPNLKNIEKPLDYKVNFSQQIDKTQFEKIINNLDFKLNEIIQSNLNFNEY